MKRRKSGFTLIEILIALVILLVGLVGILALFPVGIRSTQKSVEDSSAAIIAQSVYAALIESMRRSTPAQDTSVPPDGTSDMDGLAQLVHDGCPAPVQPNQPSYTFSLPRNQAQGIYSYPGGGGNTPPGTPPSDPPFERVFLLGSNQDSTPGMAFRDVAIDDPSESYGQYSFAFDIRREDDQYPLYEFSIKIFRNWSQGDETAAGTDSIPNNDETKRKFIKEFRTLIAGN